MTAQQYSDDELRQRLTPEQYHVLREGGTEYPGTGKLLYNSDNGEYHCAACGQLLFKSDDKYETHTPGLTGWPSFSEVAASDAVRLTEDPRFGMWRTEVTCANCGSHLGHVFPDDDSPTGTHYCINSAALEFTKEP